MLTMIFVVLTLLALVVFWKIFETIIKAFYNITVEFLKLVWSLLNFTLYLVRIMIVFAKFIISLFNKKPVEVKPVEVKKEENNNTIGFKS